ncbi:hypothetical protein D9980_10765 [Serratia sp. 3ACOL1]|nr:hypothetical protein D9980_10765 [Serratia sp. 3ACOL1]
MSIPTQLLGEKITHLVPAIFITPKIARDSTFGFRFGEIIRMSYLQIVAAKAAPFDNITTQCNV